MSKRGRGEPQELRDCGVRTSWVREWSPWGVNVAWPMVPSGLAELETAHRGAMDEVNRLKRKLPSPSDLKPVKIWPSSKKRLTMIEIDWGNNACIWTKVQEHWTNYDIKRQRVKKDHDNMPSKANKFGILGPNRTMGPRKSSRKHLKLSCWWWTLFWNWIWP